MVLLYHRATATATAGLLILLASVPPVSAAEETADSPRQSEPWAVARWATYLDPITLPQMVVDDQGNAYLAGIRNPDGGGEAQCWIAKLRPDGTEFLYEQFLGSSNSLLVTGIAIDHAGNVYVAGSKNSNATLPTTPGVILPSGGFGFVVKLNAGGDIAYITEIGQAPSAIAVDQQGHVVLTGPANLQFSATAGAFQPQSGGGTCTAPRRQPFPCPDAFLMKLNAGATAVVYASFLGGSATERGGKLAIDPAGNVYVLGETTSADFPRTAGGWQPRYGGEGQLGPAIHGDLFLTKVDPAGRNIVYSTYLGGSNAEQPLDIAVDDAGQVYLTAITYSGDFPTTPEALHPNFGVTSPPQQVRTVAAKFNSLGAAIFSTFLSDTGTASANGIAPGPEGTVILIGTLTSPNNFPLSPGSLPGCPRAQSGALLMQLSSDGSRLLKATRFGGSFQEQGGSYSNQGGSVGRDRDGNFYFLGTTYSAAFVATPGAVQPDYAPETTAFVASIAYADQLPEDPWVACAVNAASLIPGYVQHPRSVGTIAVGEIVSIFGRKLGPAEALQLELGEDGRVTSELGGVEVVFDEFAAPLLYVHRDQINAVVPFGLEGRESIRMQVLRDGSRSASFDLPLGSQSVPGIFTLNASGEGQGAILNQDGTVNSAGNPAHPGEIIAIYATGSGPLLPPGVDGEIAPLSLPLPKPALAVRVTISGLSADVLYAGAAPGLVSGVLQVNARMPSDLPPFDGELSMTLWIGDVVSPPVVIHVQPAEGGLAQ